jgi:hypothetical protein
MMITHHPNICIKPVHQLITRTNIKLITLLVHLIIPQHTTNIRHTWNKDNTHTMQHIPTNSILLLELLPLSLLYLLKTNNTKRRILMKNTDPVRLPLQENQPGRGVTAKMQTPRRLEAQNVKRTTNRMGAGQSALLGLNLFTANLWRPSLTLD